MNNFDQKAGVKQQGSEKRKTSGHEVPLASMIKNRKPVVIVTMSGKTYQGVIQSFDKYTVTLSSYGNVSKGEAHDAYKYPLTLFKHAIESFSEARG